MNKYNSQFELEKKRMGILDSTDMDTGQLYSRFWMGNVSDRVSLIELPAYRRAVARFVKIATGKDIPVYFSVRGNSYTSDQTQTKGVVLSADIKNKDFDAVVGLALHEASHILWTDWDLKRRWLDGQISIPTRLILAWEKLIQFDLYKHWGEDVLRAQVDGYRNYFEDRRIDYKMINHIPGYSPYYTALYNRYFGSKITTLGLKSDYYREEDFDSYRFRVTSLINPESDLDALKNLREISEIYDYENISRLESTADALKVALDVFTLIVEAVVAAEEQKEEQEQEQSESSDESSESGEESGENSESGETSDEESDSNGSGGESGEETESSDESPFDSDVESGNPESGDLIDDGAPQVTPETGENDEDESENDESEDGDESDENDENSDSDENGNESDEVSSKSDVSPNGESDDSDENEDDGTPEELPSLSPNQQKQLQKMLEKTQELIDGENKKKELEESENEVLKKLEQENTEITKVQESTSGTGGVNVLVVNKMDKKILEDMRCGNKGYVDDNHTLIEYPDSKAAVTEGIVLGKLLANKLQIRNEAKVYASKRRERGKIDRRQLHTIGIGSTRIFQQIRTDEYGDTVVHISLDGSGSMKNESKWKNMLKSVVAQAYAATRIKNLDVIVTLRVEDYLNWTTYSKNYKRRNDHWEDLPIMMVIYDSRVNHFSHIKNLWPYLKPTGGTPEGYCYEAILKNIIGSMSGKKGYFITYTDGAPTSCGDYSGKRASDVVMENIKKIKAMNINVLGFFISGRSSDESTFRLMYKKDGRIINVVNMTPLAKEINQMFVKQK